MTVRCKSGQNVWSPICLEPAVVGPSWAASGGCPLVLGGVKRWLCVWLTGSDPHRGNGQLDGSEAEPVELGLADKASQRGFV